METESGDPRHAGPDTRYADRDTFIALGLGLDFGARVRIYALENMARGLPETDRISLAYDEAPAGEPIKGGGCGKSAESC